MMTSFLVNMYEYMILYSPLNSIYKIYRDRQTDAWTDREEGHSFANLNSFALCGCFLRSCLVVSLSGVPGFFTPCVDTPQQDWDRETFAFLLNVGERREGRGRNNEMADSRHIFNHTRKLKLWKFSPLKPLCP